MLADNLSLHLPSQRLNRLQLIAHALLRRNPPLDIWIDLLKQRRHPLHRLLRHRTSINPSRTHRHNLHSPLPQLNTILSDNAIHHRLTRTIGHHTRNPRLGHKLRIGQPRGDVHDLPSLSRLDQGQEGVGDVDAAHDVGLDGFVKHVFDVVEVLRGGELAGGDHGRGGIEESAVVDQDVEIAACDGRDGSGGCEEGRVGVEVAGDDVHVGVACC